ncbi:ionotropic receptor 93a-like [Scylla paramamosain]|uniref:ionotropic receptor 93a-like n=1 Tax=Scylla paramamosain TaxID=85552 RepID=UPI003083A286
MHQRVAEAWRERLCTAMFEMFPGDQGTNVTRRLSYLVPLVRQVRQSSSCTTVVVVSHDPLFLAAFAEQSLRGRLLGWATKLVVVTRLALPHLKVLLPAYWTFSMMNAVFLKIDEASSSFYGARVNVTARPYTPFWEEREGPENTTLYSGTDYYTLTAIAAALNFTFHRLPTSSWAEVTRLVEERVSFMASVIYILMPDRLGRYDFSFAHEIMSTGFSMAPPILQPQWQALYYPLSGWVWAGMLIALLVTPVAFVLISTRMAGDKDENLLLGTVFHYMVGMLLAQSLSHHLFKTSSRRILVAAWLVFAIILGSAYSGNLTATLTLPKYPPRPETLKQLVDAADRWCASGC